MLGLKLIHVSKKQPRFPNSGATLSVDMGLTAHDAFHIFLAINGLNFDGSYDIIQNSSSDLPKWMLRGLIALLIVQTERLYGETLPQQKWCCWQIWYNVILFFKCFLVIS